MTFSTSDNVCRSNPSNGTRNQFQTDTWENCCGRYTGTETGEKKREKKKKGFFFWSTCGGKKIKSKLGDLFPIMLREYFNCDENYIFFLVKIKTKKKKQTKKMTYYHVPLIFTGIFSNVALIPFRPELKGKI